MSLEKRTYVKNWKYMKDDERHTVTVTKGGKLTRIKPERVSEIVEEVGRWRKANHIHKWFVDNVQDGNDDCKDYYVSGQQLTSLRDICREVIKASELVDGKVTNGYHLDSHGNRVAIQSEGRVIKDATVANKLLPTQSGFFFGGTEYDEYYLQDVIDTEEMLTKLIEEDLNGDYYYSSSW